MGRFESQWALDNPLKQLARRATGRTEDDDLASGAVSGRYKDNSTLNRDMHLQAEGEREARAEDGDTAKRTRGFVSVCASEWREQRTHENVLPKRLGVLIKTSLLLVSHPFWRMIAGFSVSQSPR